MKTHWPERQGAYLFPAQKVLLLVRSPLDCIISLFHMDCTATHDCSISDADFLQYPKWWREYIKIETTVWRDFHRYWMG